ncbi:NUDIX domain-containing protein [Candidatus Pacearchaeota archaeon]|nr:NUDIX domain-containing protein [Candidatus Pacearchaeota archaeon]
MEFVDSFGKKHIKPTEKDIKKRLSAYGVAIKDNKILLIKSKFNFLELPGGGLKSGEDILEGLKREFSEETGYIPEEINLKCLKSLKSNFYASDEDQYYDSEMRFFIINKLKKQENPNIDTVEIEDILWVPLSELSQRNLRPHHLDIIRQHLG